MKHGRVFTSRARDCRRCDMAHLCLSGGRSNKAVVLGDDYPALLRARRRRERWSDEDRRLCQRHRWRLEGCHGEAKAWHGLARAVRSGLASMTIQAYLTAAAVNLKRLLWGACCGSGRSKITPHQQQEARRRRDQGESLSSIARSFNVHHATIGRLYGS